MANLIPQATLKAHGNSIASRMIFAGACATIFSTAALSLGLMPVYFDTHTERTSREAALEILRAGMKDSEWAERGALTAIRKRSEALKRIGKEQRLTDAVAVAVAERPKGVALRAFIYSREDGVSSLSVTGSAPSSELFKQYTEALKGKTPVDKVVIPLTSIVGSGGGSFTFTLNGTF